MAYSFDGPARVITITAQTAMDVKDLYSRWADWVNTGDNSKYLPAFSTVGGEAIDATAGTSIPIYAFMQNNWRIRPQESNHTLNITGGVLLGPGGGDPFINTLGAFTVRVNYSQPVQAVTVATGGLTVDQVAMIQRLVDLAEADEEFTATQATKRHRTTNAVLLQKAVTGGQIANPPIVISE